MKSNFIYSNEPAILMGVEGDALKTPWWCTRNEQLKSGVIDRTAADAHLDQGANFMWVYDQKFLKKRTRYVRCAQQNRALGKEGNTP